MHLAEVRVSYAALQVALVKARMLEASEELFVWAGEWLGMDEDEQQEFREEFDLDEPDASLY